MRTTTSSGAPWERTVGYSRATRAGDRVYVTGTTAFLPEGGHVGDGNPYTQTRQALANVAAALERLGATLEDVVRTRMFVVDIERDWRAIGRAHAEVLGHVRPATSMVEVRRLIAPWMLVEVEADAVVGERSSAPGGVAAGGEDGGGVGVSPAGLNEGGLVARLLEPAGLPVPDERDRPVHVRLARRGGEVLGCVGYERDGAHALLRSVAVRPDARGTGVGRTLVRAVLDELRAQGAEAVHLLTLDAERFFGRFGFATSARQAMPEEIARSREARLHCGADAIYMCLKLPGESSG